MKQSVSWSWRWRTCRRADGGRRCLAAHFLAYVVIANRRYTDLFEWGQRSVPLSLAAEIQHRLLPGAFTCEAGQFTLAAWLEPAGEIGGDTFDFTLDRDTLHLSMTDAMGHTMEAALLATVLVGGLRNARRRGVDLAEQARLANDALADQAGDEQFVTGLLVRIDLAAATAGIVNAGHPPPFRVRAGQVEQIQLQVDHPFGMKRGGGHRVQALPLEVGDRLMFVTDGMLERDAELVNISAILTASRSMHAREAVQHLTQEVLDASGGELRDDATALCLDWEGGLPRDRDADSGQTARYSVASRRHPRGSRVGVLGIHALATKLPAMRAELRGHSGTLAQSRVIRPRGDNHGASLALKHATRPRATGRYRASAVTRRASRGRLCCLPRGWRPARRVLARIACSTRHRLRSFGGLDARNEHSLPPRHLEPQRATVDATRRPRRDLPADRGHLHASGADQP